MTEERRKGLLELPGLIVLIRKPDDENVYGIVEGSFSLDYQRNQTFFYWSTSSVSAESWADRDVKSIHKAHPDWAVSVYDVHAPDLPVVLDWERWLRAHEFSSKTLSGMVNKYEARNFSFVVKSNFPIQKHFRFKEVTDVQTQI